jgi:predicted component of type VI protein secretion system
VLNDIARDMVDKLDDYYQQALKKSVYAISSILDARIKLNYLKHHVSKNLVPI